MRFNYKTMKEISDLVLETRADFWKTRYIETSSSELMLDDVIKQLDELTSSKSKLVDFDSLKSDIEFLKEYYKEKSWGDVIRWLSNIDSELRDSFSNYMDAIKNTSKDKNISLDTKKENNGAR